MVESSATISLLQLYVRQPTSVRPKTFQAAQGSNPSPGLRPQLVSRLLVDRVMCLTLAERPKATVCTGHCCWTGSQCSGFGVIRLARNCLVVMLLTWGSALFLAASGLILAIIPWLRAPDVPRAAVYPVLLIVFGKSAEVATLLGIPTGLAVGASIHTRTEPRKSDGKAQRSKSRWRLALALICVIGATFGVLTLACINYWSLSPGRMARSALTTARERCLAEPGAPGVAIPIIGAMWSCDKPGMPRLEGLLPGSNRLAWFSAGNVEVSDDLLTVDLEDVRIGVRRTGQTPKMQLRTPHASVHGVRAVFRPAHLGPWLRALLGVGTGFAGGTRCLPNTLKTLDTTCQRLGTLWDERVVGQCGLAGCQHPSERLSNRVP